MVDTGSSVNVMYRICFNQMGLEPEYLSSSPEPLYGFTRDSVVPVGWVTFPFTIGDANRQATTLTKFLIVYCEQHLARRCYEDVVKIGAKGKKVNVIVRNNPQPSNQRGVSHDLDPREVDCDKPTSPVKELEDIPVNKADEERCLRLGKSLAPKVNSQLTNFLKANLDVFAWNHEDMVRIAPEVMSHRFNVDPSYNLVSQKRRLVTPERYGAPKKEVDKLLANEFIREAHYPIWVANPILVKKKNEKYMTCVDFTDLNKACPKNSFALPRIDQFVDATTGHQLLNFMDAYSGYNQIPMNPSNKEHTLFITDQGLYCYKEMPFGLKNAGATNQRLVNMMFEALIGKTMEVYVDNMLVKSERVADHVFDLGEMFKVLGSYQMKLKLLKYTGRISSQGHKNSSYLKKLRELLATFDKYEIRQIPRSQNSHTDALACLATARDAEFLGAIPVEFLATPSTE
ncbi:uncharacterized protein LOC127802133 [Diospyros lotus]|uniref:uncharacterized protein LOC127802133 n=1 Tax=Diospyros lotus TaxID=55363 RepID=UPI00225A389F|nr:uncharacterized protein LOC127802133 [Diospyros lotus]